MRRSWSVISPWRGLAKGKSIVLPDGAVIQAGGRIIDTPGMRTLHVSKVEEGLATAFSDVETLSARCRFGNCTHTGEPGCAVKAALADGSLPEKRWETYLAMKREEQHARQREKILERKQGRTKKKYQRSRRLEWE